MTHDDPDDLGELVWILIYAVFAAAACVVAFVVDDRARDVAVVLSFTLFALSVEQALTLPTFPWPWKK